MYESKTKLCKFQQFWMSLPKKEKGVHRRRLLLLLRLSDYSFYSRLRSGTFQAHERALISAYFSLPQTALFPSEPVVFEKVNLSQVLEFQAKSILK